VIDLLPPARRVGLLLATLLMCAITFFTVRAEIVHAISPDTAATRIIGWVIAAMFGALALLSLSKLPAMLTGRRLLIGSQGIAQHTVGARFGVPWAEIGAIRVWSGTRQSDRSTRQLVRLEWWPAIPPGPAGPGPAAGPRPLYGTPSAPDHFALRLGPSGAFLGQLDAALATWAGPRYRPPFDGGELTGLRYT
jgi:hypothetical protein